MDDSNEPGWENSVDSRTLDGCSASSESCDSLFDSCRLGRRASSFEYEYAGSVDTKKRLFLSGADDAYCQISSSGACIDKLLEVETLDASRLDDISLRMWLDEPERSVDYLKCFYIFRQIVEVVNLAHSQGIVVHNIRPSCFVMSPMNRVSFIESASSSSSTSGSVLNEHDEKIRVGEVSTLTVVQDGDSSADVSISPTGAFRRRSEMSCLPTSASGSGRHASYMKGTEDQNVDTGNTKIFPQKQILLMELNWYTSPEEAASRSSSFASDIYRLGILLFELFCTVSSMEEKLPTMSNLRHRLLPPQILLKWPKEASFCLWLLHPQPNSRPKMCEVLQSEFLNEPRDKLEVFEAAIRTGEEIEEQELLSGFLLQLRKRKQKIADKLQNSISCLHSDIEEVKRQQLILKKKRTSSPELIMEEYSSLDKACRSKMHHVSTVHSPSFGSRKHCRLELQINSKEASERSTGVHMSSNQSDDQERNLSKNYRLMKNFNKLKSAYFASRFGQTKQTIKPLLRDLTVESVGRGSVSRTEGILVGNPSVNDVQIEGKKSGLINPFLEGLCKYLAFSRFHVWADLKQGDLLNSSNLICSLGFDRDREFFATAGVNRKIKIFEYDAIINQDRDIHYPVTEMACKSKLSSICWNSYVKSQIASSDFEGILQVWDVTKMQACMEMREHERRVWSIDFSKADPMMLASGSDDGAIKLWNINQGGSLATIRTRANVCCVQFSPHPARVLAVGSADHNIYCYDLRHSRVPWCTLTNHTKTVSYVKFVDSSNLVSASTDNSLKLWDLSMSTSGVLDSPVRSFTGHTNSKSFVGLSISDGYIATGSETNEVFVYHKAFPMPVLSFKFSSQEVDDASQFISSVCWRGQSPTLAAANSTGSIKLLEMV